jgi:hypothetical protein
MRTKARTAIAALLVGATAALGVGCTGQPPANEWEAERQAVWIGNGIFFLIYSALCNANGGVCPFPIAPSDPLVVAPS